MSYYKHQIRSAGFTLIELLVVMAVIAILAGLLLNTSGAASRDKNRARIKASLSELTTVIEEYHARMGFYPPTGTGDLALDRPTLYYELVGTTFDKGASIYTTLDGRETVPLNEARDFFKIDGFVNSGLKQGDAKNLFVSLRKDGYAQHPDAAAANRNLGVLVVPVKSEDRNGNIQPSLIWKYNSRNPTNNAGRYDVWVEWRSKGKEEIIGNF